VSTPPRITAGEVGDGWTSSERYHFSRRRQRTSWCRGRAGAWRRSVGREHQLFCPRCPVRTEVPTTERHDNLGGGGHLSVWVNLLGYRGFRRVSRAGDGQGDVLRMRSSCLGGRPTAVRRAPIEVTEARVAKPGLRRGPDRRRSIRWRGFSRAATCG
jgi:hypothetical protein